MDDFDGVRQRASEMGVKILVPRDRNPPDEGGPNHSERRMRDPDGSVVVIAGPDGTAGGTSRPASRNEDTTVKMRRAS